MSSALTHDASNHSFVAKIFVRKLNLSSGLLSEECLLEHYFQNHCIFEDADVLVRENGLLRHSLRRLVEENVLATAQTRKRTIAGEVKYTLYSIHPECNLNKYLDNEPVPKAPKGPAACLKVNGGRRSKRNQIDPDSTNLVKAAARVLKFANDPQGALSQEDLGKLKEELQSLVAPPAAWTSLLEDNTAQPKTPRSNSTLSSGPSSSATALAKPSPVRDLELRSASVEEETIQDKVSKLPWLGDGLAKLKEKYPDDDLSVVFVDGILQIKCADCPGRLYAVSRANINRYHNLHNLEDHSRGLGHVEKLFQRLRRTNQTPKITPGVQSRMEHVGRLRNNGNPARFWFLDWRPATLDRPGTVSAMQKSVLHGSSTLNVQETRSRSATPPPPPSPTPTLSASDSDERPMPSPITYSAFRPVSFYEDLIETEDHPSKRARSSANPQLNKNKHNIPAESASDITKKLQTVETASAERLHKLEQQNEALRDRLQELGAQTRADALLASESGNYWMSQHHAGQDKIEQLLEAVKELEAEVAEVDGQLAEKRRQRKRDKRDIGKLREEVAELKRRLA